MLFKALCAVGVDARELTDADEFFGTAALKSYNTFLRPRPKQLAKVRHFPLHVFFFLWTYFAFRRRIRRAFAYLAYI